jgi:DNA repair photolyase
VCLDGVFGNEKLRGDLAIAEAAGDQGEDFELAGRDAEGLLAGRIGSEGFTAAGFRGSFRRDSHFPHHDRFADGFATARDAEAKPDAEGREQDGDERAVELDGVLDDDEAVFGVLEGGDEEAADETENEDVALHGREEVYPQSDLTQPDSGATIGEQMANIARAPVGFLPGIQESCRDAAGHVSTDRAENRDGVGVIDAVRGTDDIQTADDGWLLDDCSPRPQLIGIARMAAEGESLREGHNIEYFTLESRSLLSKVVSQRNLPFTWAINPYRGCEFACKYCYARYTHEFMELRDGVDFERKIFIKKHAAELLRRELKRVKRGEQIAIGTATDPYQPAERRFEVTRAILEEFARHSGLEIGMVTKSNLVTRDAGIFRQIAEKNRLFVNVTITTVDVELARKLEPRAPRPDLRLEAVRQLNLAGVNAGVICAPVLPDITDRPRDLEALVKAASEAGAKYVYANALFLKPCSAAVFFPFLEAEFPKLMEVYRARYRERAFLPKGYAERLSRLMSALREKYGFDSKQASARAHVVGDEQMALFG